MYQCISEAFNGLSGKVESLDEKTGRYEVMLVSNSGEKTVAKIKGERLGLRELQTYHRISQIEWCKIIVLVD